MMAITSSFLLLCCYFILVRAQAHGEVSRAGSRGGHGRSASRARHGVAVEIDADAGDDAEATSQLRREFHGLDRNALGTPWKAVSPGETHPTSPKNLAQSVRARYPADGSIRVLGTFRGRPSLECWSVDRVPRRPFQLPSFRHLRRRGRSFGRF